MSRKTTQKAAMVIGASGGIGSEVVSRLDKLGYDLQLIDINEGETRALAAKCRNASVKIADLNDIRSITALSEEIANGIGAVDIAFINAGIIVPGDLVDISPEQVQRQLTINLTSPALLIQAFAKAMAKQQSGHIIATVSMGGIVSLKTSASYSASKFGLRGLLMGLKYELAPLGVAVSGLYPSGVDTQMLQHEAKNGGSALNFVSRPVSVSDVADAFEKVLKTKQVEAYPCYSDSLSGRFSASFPWLLRFIYPPMEALGERGRKKYLAELDGRSNPK